jgi:sigma-B regulation protein RsbU (phosphoserine phosphatase)
MYPDLDNSHRFVTLFYSEYDPVTRTLSFCNAAHHPPLMWRAEGQTIEKLDTDGMLIGLDLDSTYEEAQVVLEPGDIVLYYTDGFTDAVNAHGDRFDEDNLRAVFQSACESCKNPNEIVHKLFTKVEQFTYPNIRNGDDMTLVVVQVQSDAADLNKCQE